MRLAGIGLFLFGLELLGFGITALAWAGEVDGQINGWRPAGPDSQRNGVVWLSEQRISVHKPAPQLVMAQTRGHFVPSFLVVMVGQSVAMPNEDEVAHNVYSNSPAKTFNLGFYAKGDRRVVNFDVPGVVEVDCSIHQNMHATIVVVPNSYYASVRVDGTFHLANVPQGDYILNLWGEGVEPVHEHVEVTPSGKVDVNLMATPRATSDR
jgi:plastocyanin